MAVKPSPYWEYIRVEALLSLQAGTASTEAEISNDEVMFIVVHQIDELWFKLVLREMVAVRDLFARPTVPEQALASAVRGIRRMETIVRQLAGHFALMETMTTRDYLAFRDKLAGASGFQSAQMREIEILMGLPDAERLPLGHDQSYLAALREHDGSESPALRRVRARLADRPSLRDALLEWIHRTPIQGSVPAQPDDGARVLAFVEAYLARHALAAERGLDHARGLGLAGADLSRLEGRVRQEVASARAYLLALDTPEESRARASRIRAALVFIESYREVPLLAWPRETLDALTSFEQAFVIFRQRHARMVERMIGRRTGTGGSSGVDYLDATALKYRVFQELWAVRTLLVRAQDLPALEDPARYDFAGGS
ncbi:MAG: tryptophan 2,3-dioxygenase [Myxococcales bacterium]|nr:tryptophan 2,3-dioxygenase [Myxococcales bacterium]